MNAMIMTGGYRTFPHPSTISNKYEHRHRNTKINVEMEDGCSVNDHLVHLVVDTAKFLISFEAGHALAAKEWPRDRMAMYEQVNIFLNN